jgi:hypothetical protein
VRGAKATAGRTKSSESRQRKCWAREINVIESRQESPADSHLLTDNQRHADRARCRASNLTTPQTSTGAGASPLGRCDWMAGLLARCWRRAEWVLGQETFGCRLQMSICGNCVVVSCADGAGAVRRDCCGDCEADAYTAQDMVVVRLSAISNRLLDQGCALEAQDSRPCCG